VCLPNPRAWQADGSGHPRADPVPGALGSRVPMDRASSSWAYSCSPPCSCSDASTPARAGRLGRDRHHTTTTTPTAPHDHDDVDHPPEAVPNVPVLVVNASGQTGAAGAITTSSRWPGGHPDPMDATPTSPPPPCTTGRPEGRRRGGGLDAPPAASSVLPYTTAAPVATIAPPTSSSWSPRTWRPPCRRRRPPRPPRAPDPTGGGRSRDAGPPGTRRRCSPRSAPTRRGRCWRATSTDLAPIWRSRPRRGPRRTAALLARLADRFATVAVVSGRPAAFLADRCPSGPVPARAPGRADRSLRMESVLPTDVRPDGRVAPGCRSSPRRPPDWRRAPDVSSSRRRGPPWPCTGARRRMPVRGRRPTTESGPHGLEAHPGRLSVELRPPLDIDKDLVRQLTEVGAPPASSRRPRDLPPSRAVPSVRRGRPATVGWPSGTPRPRPSATPPTCRRGPRGRVRRPRVVETTTRTARPADARNRPLAASADGASWSSSQSEAGGLDGVPQRPRARARSSPRGQRPDSTVPCRSRRRVDLERTAGQAVKAPASGTGRAPLPVLTSGPSMATRLSPSRTG